MNIEILNIELSDIPVWIVISLFSIIIISFIAFLYLGISGKRDVKLWQFEIKNTKLSISKEKQELSKVDGTWEVKGRDIEVPLHPFITKYCYEADIRLEAKKYEIELTGHLTFRNYHTNEKVFDTNIEGYGYLTDGQGSITYETYVELYKKRLTTGLGVIYVKFNLNGNKAIGYFLTSNQSEFGVGIGTIAMERKS